MELPPDSKWREKFRKNKLHASNETRWNKNYPLCLRSLRLELLALVIIPTQSELRLQKEDSLIEKVYICRKGFQSLATQLYIESIIDAIGGELWANLRKSWE